MTKWQTSAQVGDGALVAVVNSMLWHHRKVESFRLMDGPRSRRRVSLDITVPSDPRMRTWSPTNAGDPASSELVVPLGIVRKSRLQDFDATIGDSTPVPIADTSLNGHVAVEMLRSAWTADCGSAPPKAVVKVLRRVVFGRHSDGHVADTMRFIEGGVWGGETHDVAALSQSTRQLIAGFASNFLLVGLLPWSERGKHLIVKYSEHWELVGVSSDGGDLSAFDRLLTSAGWYPASLQIDLNDVGLAPESYHLEVHAPSGFVNQRLMLLQGDRVVASDARRSVVSHVVGGHAIRPQHGMPEAAVVELRTAARGLLPWSAIASLFSLVFFGVTATMVDRLLSTEARGSTALFLAAIAVLLGFLSRESENPVSSRLLTPLRGAVAVLALEYFTLGAAVALGTAPVGGRALWLTSVVITAALGALTLTGWLKSRWLTVDRPISP